MKTSDTSEKGLEALIVHSLVADSGYESGKSEDFDRGHAVDLKKLFLFLNATQPDSVQALGILEDGPKREKFLHRLQGEIAKRGVIDVFRNGVKEGPASLNLYFGTASSGNLKSQELFRENIFSVTRQLHYSQSDSQRSLDFVIFLNGLPFATFELKNNLTKQTVSDAVEQYKKDRDPKELLFQFGRCLVHFAVDDQEVRMCTHLKGKESWFLPFNKGWNDGAGNPPNSNGLKTDYLWKEILRKESVANILENYAQTVIIEKRSKNVHEQIFPRYHQLDVVGKLLYDSKKNGVGKKYLIQHSAGSGKSNSIAWLAHQLIGLETKGKAIFDSVIVVTDRRILDRQISDTIKQFAQVSSTVGHADRSGALQLFLQSGKKIIISTVQKFPFILDEINVEKNNQTYAIIIDEAHSSQGGKTSGNMNRVIAKSSRAEESFEDDESVEDKINEIMEGRKMLSNASYFAFTATPKNKTLEIFGVGYTAGNQIKHRPFHSYTMKQAIQEGFILDVLKNYTPVGSYYRLLKKIEDDPEFDTMKAKKKLRHYVESNDYAIRQKAEIMIDHFHDHVISRNKIGGKARAMIVTNGIERAIQYFFAFKEYLKERKSPFLPIIAFSGEKEIEGKEESESSLNSFASTFIPDKFREDPYRFLIVADKFQTGYDEPLLHTMYVDKILSGIKAVQTLSRLNRAHPQKYDTFVLDFMNDTETIREAFADYYRTTILSDETDPNRLHDLKSALDGRQVYNWNQVEEFVKLFIQGSLRDSLDPILDSCVEVYKDNLDENGQIDFKGRAKTFTRTYNFLASILPYNIPEWEKLSIFLNYLIPKLPAPIEEDLSQGILESIDMESYRAEVHAMQSISLPDEDSEIDPMPTSGGGGKRDPELDRLSNILRNFNDLFGNIDWKDEDKIRDVIANELPAKVSADAAYQNAILQSDEQNARIEHDKALERAIVGLVSDHTELFKQYADNPGFTRWLNDTIFSMTYKKQTRPKAK